MTVRNPLVTGGGGFHGKGLFACINKVFDNHLDSFAVSYNYLGTWGQA